MRAKGVKVTVEHFVVEGQGMFPFDMLRYDSCCPDRSDDAHQLVPMTEMGMRCRRRVRLRRYALNNAGPTEARWASFGWIVVRDDYGTLVQDT